MLGSFGSSSREVEEDEPSPPEHHHVQYHQIQQYRSFTSPTLAHMRQLLISCAELMSSSSDSSSAHRLITILMANSNPYGDSTERLIHQFTRALSLRLNRYATTTLLNTLPNTQQHLGHPLNNTFFLTHRHHHHPTTSFNSSPVNSANAASFSAASINHMPQVVESDEQALLQTAYLSLNQVTPFIRFSQLTANQAILDAIDQGQEAIHILDFNIMHGLQWPPFMQAIVERYPRPSLRITGTGNDLETLRRTGDRLAKFAHSLGLRFQFHPLHLHNEDDPIAVLSSAVVLLPGESLAVNCVHYLHRLLKDRDGLRLFLHRIKVMNPRVVTMAEREANHNHPLFLQRFVEALDHYAAVFDSLEATLPPNSRERLNVEQVWFGREIVDIVAADGDHRRERHERFRSWELMFRSCGFNNVPLSPFALSQAKLLLRLHYPSEGYQLHILNDSFFLGWQNQLLYSVSSWR
ncbi:scarecrow-like protein 18 [Coffea arabica]|uniref:Scarecrow-like protein 18 n=1 Tax=Coffea arabica TaxID=13443 RepID=A0ABM4UK86_COFAR